MNILNCQNITFILQAINIVYMAKHNILGKFGEDVAAEFLIKKGYVIRERNWRLDKIEVDIVAEYNNRIIIVEVKTRTSSLLSAYDAIDKNKQDFLLRAANSYVKYTGLPHEVQIDIICIVGDNQNNFKIEHIPDAVRPRLRSYRRR